ncbi:unnamed protein product [Caenorhabditis sp. 36 PRJEB53466]|nr:unnamed protein product [Caenorhabditis sp. 36 PRJEB53466]
MQMRSNKDLYKLDEIEENREEDPRVQRRTMKHIDNLYLEVVGTSVLFAQRGGFQVCRRTGLLRKAAHDAEMNCCLHIPTQHISGIAASYALDILVRRLRMASFLGRSYSSSSTLPALLVSPSRSTSSNPQKVLIIEKRALVINRLNLRLLRRSHEAEKLIS